MRVIPKTRHFLTLLGRVAAASLVLVPALVAGPPPWAGGPEEPPGKPDHEIDLEVVGTKLGETAIEPESGWPVTVVLRADEDQLLGIGVPETTSGFFPDLNDEGYLVFANPDGCPSWVLLVFQQAHNDLVAGGGPGIYPDCVQPPPPTPWPFDETWVEFIPGLTPGGSECDVDPSTEDVPDCEDRPTVPSFDFDTGLNTSTSEVGPRNLGSVEDGYGYGPSGRLPGFVLVADTGPSIVTDASFDLPDPIHCRNLAGFANSVAYELKSARGTTDVWMHMNVPPELFTPVVLIDRDVDADCSGDGIADDAIIRVDGGSQTCVPGGANAIDFIVNELVVTARAFVVNGDAPATLDDLNGNGLCDAEDAEMAGFELLSGEELFQFRQFHEEAFGVFFDFDGNGEVGSVVLPGGAGTLQEAPR